MAGLWLPCWMKSAAGPTWALTHRDLCTLPRLEIRYRKNVPVEQPLRIVGNVLKSKSRTATASGVIYGPEGDVLAEADALMVDVPDDFVQSADLEALGWKVYEE